MSEQDLPAIVIKVDTRGAKKAIVGLGSSVDDVDKKGRKAGKQLTTQMKLMEKSTKGASKAVKALGASLAGLASFAVLKKLISLTSDFETGLVGVAKTTGLAGKELQKLSGDIDALSRRIPVTTNELLELGQAAGQLGVKGSDNILLFSETIAKLGRASDLSGEQAAQTLARILNVTNESVSSIGTFASVLVSLGNNVAATEKQIARITNELARTTSMFGVSSAEAAALGATMAALGVRAESGGSATGRVFRTIQAAISGTSEDLAEFSGALGISGEVLSKTFKEDKIAGLMLFLEAIRDLGSEHAGTVLKDIGLGGEEIAKTFGPLSQNLEKYITNQKLANAEVANATALNREFEATLKTFDSQLIVLQNNFASIGRAVGNVFIDSFTKSFESASKTINKFVSDEDQLNDAIEETIGLVKVLGTIMITVFAGQAILAFVPIAISALTSVGVAITTFGGLVTVHGLKAAAFSAHLASIGTAGKIATTGMAALGSALSLLGAGFVGVQIGTWLSELETVKAITIGVTDDIVSAFLDAKLTVATFFAEVANPFDRLNFLKIQEQLQKAHKEDMEIHKAKIKILIKTNEGMNGESAAAKALRLEWEKLNPLMIEFNKKNKEAGETTEKTSKSLQTMKADVMGLGDSYESVFDLMVDFDNEQQAMLDSLEPLRAQQDAYNDTLLQLAYAHGQNKLSLERYLAAQQELKRQNEDLFPEFKKQREEAELLAGAWEEAGFRIDEAFADAWKGAFNSFEDFASGIKDALKSLLAELAHQLITKKLLLNITGGISGAFVSGAASAASSAAGAGAGSAAISGLGIAATFKGLGASLTALNQNIASILPQGLGGQVGKVGAGTVLKPTGIDFTAMGVGLLAGIAGNAIGGALGESISGKTAANAVLATAGAVIGSIWGPLGTFIGASLGSFLDAIFGTKHRDPEFTIGTTNQSPTEIFRGGDLNKSTQSAFGGLRLQTQHDLLSEATQQQVDALTGFFDSIAKLEDSIASGLSEDELTRVKRELAKQGDVNIENGLDFEGFLAERFFRIFEQISGRVGIAYKSLIEGIGDKDVVSSINELAAGAQIIGRSEGDLKTYFNTFSKWTLEIVGSGLALIAMNETLGGLRKGMLSLDEAGSAAAARILEVAGGFENLQQLVGQFETLFPDSDEDKLSSFKIEIKNIFDTLNIAIPETKNAFKTLVKELDLSTVANQEALPVLLAIAPAFSAMIDAMAEADVAADIAAQSARKSAQAEIDRAAAMDISAAAMVREQAVRSASLARTQAITNGAGQVDLAQLDLAGKLSTLNSSAPWIKSLSQLRTITPADFAAYSKSNQSLILNVLNAGNSLDSANASAKAAAAAVTTFGSANNFAAQTAAAAAAAVRAAADAERKRLAELNALTRDYEKSQNNVLKIFNDQKKALEGVADKFKKLSITLRDFSNNLLVGDLSTLSPAQKFAESRRQFNSVANAAKLGDAGAISSLPNVAKAFLTASREFNASGGSYSSDFDLVRETLDTVINVSDNAAAHANTQVSLMESSLSEFIDINSGINEVVTLSKAVVLMLQAQNSLLSFSTGQGVNSVLTPEMAALLNPEGSFAVGIKSVPGNMTARLHKGEEGLSPSKARRTNESNEELLEEVKKLRTESAFWGRINAEEHIKNTQMVEESGDKMVKANRLRTNTGKF